MYQTFAVQASGATLHVPTTKFSSRRPLSGAFSFHGLTAIVYMISSFRLGVLSAPVDSLVLARFTTHNCMRSSWAPYSHFRSGSCNDGGQTHGPSL